MSLPQDSSESSGYNTSASSEFGSLDDRFKLPTVRPSKRRAEEHVKELDEMMKEQLNLSPEKRVRLCSAGSSPSGANASGLYENGRPPTRRSSSIDPEMSPRVRNLRAASSGNSIDMIRSMSAVSSDSISPKLLKHYSSPKKRISMHDNGSIYSKHRLGSTFSPLVAGARRKIGTPASGYKGYPDRPAAVNSPRLSGFRKSGVMKMKRPLGDRFQDRLDS